jgi:hypothetical protein
MEILDEFIKELEEEGSVGVGDFSDLNNSVFYEGRDVVRDGVIKDIE